MRLSTALQQNIYDINGIHLKATLLRRLCNLYWKSGLTGNYDDQWRVPSFANAQKQQRWTDLSGHGHHHIQLLQHFAKVERLCISVWEPVAHNWRWKSWDMLVSCLYLYIFATLKVAKCHWSVDLVKPPQPSPLRFKISHNVHERGWLDWRTVGAAYLLKTSNTVD